MLGTSESKEGLHIFEPGSVVSTPEGTHKYIYDPLTEGLNWRVHKPTPIQEMFGLDKLRFSDEDILDRLAKGTLVRVE